MKGGGLARKSVGNKEGSSEGCQYKIIIESYISLLKDEHLPAIWGVDST